MAEQISQISESEDEKFGIEVIRNRGSTESMEITVTNLLNEGNESNDETLTADNNEESIDETNDETNEETSEETKGGNTSAGRMTTRGAPKVDYLTAHKGSQPKSVPQKRKQNEKEESKRETPVTRRSWQ